MNRRIAIVGVLLVVFALRASAYDFAVRLSYGDSLFFTITSRSGLQVKVVAPNPDGADYYRGHRQPQGVLTIPGEVTWDGQKYTVTAIGERAFSGCSGIRTVSIPETVRDIEGYAFYSCTGLRGTVIIGENIESVGASAFYGCPLVTGVIFRARRCRQMGGSMSGTVFGNCRSLRRIRIEEGVRMIPDYAFCGLDALSDTLTLPSTLETIGEYAFAYCSSLKGRLVIPDRVETIGECAFHQCHSFTALELGSSVGLIEGRAFYHCIGLRHVKVKSFAPPIMQSTSFAELRKGVGFSVPCVSKRLYMRDDDWHALGPFTTHGGCKFAVKAALQEPEAGSIEGGGYYGYGDSVKLTVVCAAGYGFDGWSDGVRENPRRFAASDNVVLQALTRPSGTQVIRDTVTLVDTVWSEGLKVIRDTVDLSEVAQSINNIKEVTFDAAQKVLSWKLKRGEAVLSVSLYDQQGECVYTGNGRRGRVDMRRRPSGSYIVRIETLSRVIRCRFFMNNSDNSYRF